MSCIMKNSYVFHAIELTMKNIYICLARKFCEEIPAKS